MVVLLFSYVFSMLMVFLMFFSYVFLCFFFFFNGGSYGCGMTYGLSIFPGGFSPSTVFL